MAATFIVDIFVFGFPCAFFIMAFYVFYKFSNEETDVATYRRQ